MNKNKLVHTKVLNRSERHPVSPYALVMSYAWDVMLHMLTKASHEQREQFIVLLGGKDESFSACTVSKWTPAQICEAALDVCAPGWDEESSVG